MMSYKTEVIFHLLHSFEDIAFMHKITLLAGFASKSGDTTMDNTTQTVTSEPIKSYVYSLY